LSSNPWSTPAEWWLVLVCLLVGVAAPAKPVDVGDTYWRDERSPGSESCSSPLARGVEHWRADEIDDCCP
jgi:hypothetical protein